MRASTSGDDICWSSTEITHFTNIPKNLDSKYRRWYRRICENDKWFAVWMSLAVWWSIKDVSDRRDWRDGNYRRERNIATRIAALEERSRNSGGSVSSRVLKYFIACEVAGRGGEISTVAAELIVEGREPSRSFIILRSIRSTMFFDQWYPQRASQQPTTMIGHGSSRDACRPTDRARSRAPSLKRSLLNFSNRIQAISSYPWWHKSNDSNNEFC